AADDDHVDPFDLADGGHRTRDLERGAFTLDARRANDDVRVRVAASQDLDDVAHGGAVERCHHANLSRQRGQGTLAPLVKQPFACEALFELIEGELSRAEALRL